MYRFKLVRDGIQKLIKTTANMHNWASVTPHIQCDGGQKGWNGRIQEGAGSIPTAVQSESSHILIRTDHVWWGRAGDPQRFSPLPIRVKSNTIYRTKMTLHSAKLFFKSQVEESGRRKRQVRDVIRVSSEKLCNSSNSPNAANSKTLWEQERTPSADSSLPEKSTNLASNLPILVEVVVTSMASCPPPSTTCIGRKSQHCSAAYTICGTTARVGGSPALGKPPTNPAQPMTAVKSPGPVPQ